jgi:hypothetical protein
MASVEAELATEQRNHTNCVTALLVADEQNPSASPTPTASDSHPVADANPINMVSGISPTNFAIEHGAIGRDSNVPYGYTPLAIFPNMGTGMSAAVALFELPAVAQYTVTQEYENLIDPNVPTATGVKGAAFAFYAVTGLDPGTTKMSTLTPAQINDAVGAMSSASEGYHPASCYP